MDRSRNRNGARTGAILVLAVFTLPVIFAFCAFAIDVGYIALVDGELQNAADSAALAGANKMLQDRGIALTADANATIDEDFYDDARSEAVRFASMHEAGGVVVNVRDIDVTFGRYDPNDPGAALDTSTPSEFNTCRVTTRRDANLNGPLNLFFGRILGMAQLPLQDVAQASFTDEVQYLRPNPTGGPSTLMPFAIKREIWDALMDAQNDYNDGTPLDDLVDALQDQFPSEGQTFSDDFKYDNEYETVSNQSDEIMEMMMFPDRVSGGKGKSGVTPGNFGTVDVGQSNNSTADLSRQILYGPNEADFDAVGGELDFSAPFLLNGDTGISAGIKDELEAIIGQCRTILLYETVTGNGNNAMFTIVGIVGIRVVYVELTGGDKRIMIQPSYCEDYGFSDGPDGSLYNVTSKVRLTL